VKEQNSVYIAISNLAAVFLVILLPNDTSIG